MPETRTSPPASSADLSSLRIQRDMWEPPRRRRLPVWVALAAVLLGLAAVAYPVARSLAVFAPEVTTVPVILERPASSGALLTSSGYVIPRTKASVSTKISGRLQELAVEEGDHVTAGDVLGRIEQRELEAQARAAGAALEEARARLAHAEALREQASLERHRQRVLFTDGVGTKAALDAAEAQAKSTAASVGEAEAAIRTHEARRAAAQVALDDATIRAPFDGTILRKEADVGESVAPAVASGQTTRGAIVTMADLSRLDVEADVSEANIYRIEDGQPAEVSLDAVDDRRYRGRVRQILPTADREKATVKVKVAIEDADGRVKPEMSAKVTFLENEPDAQALQAPPVLTVPASAVQAEGTTAVAWVVKEGRAHRRQVGVGATRGERIVVLSGLEEGDSVIASPASGLTDGGKVKVKS